MMLSIKSGGTGDWGLGLGLGAGSTELDEVSSEGIKGAVVHVTQCKALGSRGMRWGQTQGPAGGCGWTVGVTALHCPLPRVTSRGAERRGLDSGRSELGGPATPCSKQLFVFPLHRIRVLVGGRC